jgi:tetratricopeptide (TPR) repeat protein
MTVRAPVAFAISCIATCLALGLGASASAQEAEEKEGKREAPTIDVSTGKRLNEAIEALNAQKYEEAKAALSKMNLEKLSPYEKSRVYQIYASIAGAQNDFDGVRKNMQLAISSGGLNEEEQQEARYQIAQMFIAQERWQDGINALNEWFATAVNPNSTAYYLLAVAYYQLKQVDKALVPAQKAVDLAESPRDSWIQLLLALRIDKEQYAEAVPLLKRLVVSDPGKKNYWIQLSGVNRQLERYDDSLAVLELANVAGLLTTDSELRQLADLEAFVEIPYRAATLMERAIAKGQIKPDERVYERLGYSWIQARNYEKAIAPLSKAGELHDTGDTFVRLAEVQIQRQNWAGATDALQKALAKGRLKDTGNTQLLMGIAFYSNKQPKEAKTWFQRALAHEKVRKQAETWIKHIDAEQSSS